MTGDIGFSVDGEVYVVGRTKDIIIIGGKNLYPEDIEDVVGSVPSVMPGRVVAFGIEDGVRGTERIGIVAETKLIEHAERMVLRRDVVHACAEIDIAVADVFFAPPRWLIKSSSGKLSRRDNALRANAELQDDLWLTNPSIRA